MMPAMSTRVVSPTFAGRLVELDRLRAARDRASGGVPSTVLISGEAGVGKTRLVTEATSMARAEGFGVIVGGAIGLGDSDLPYGPFTEAFRSLLADVGRERIIEAAGEGAVHLARLVPGLGDAPAGLVQSPDDGVNSRPRLFEAVLDVLGRLALERPIVLVLEDLHWADPSSRALLTFLAGRLRDERLVLIGTYRSDELTRRHPLLPLLALLERLPSVERIDLSRLDRDEVQAQIAGILGTVPGARFVDNVLARSDGNPFFVEELLTSSSRDRRGAVSPTLQEILLAGCPAWPRRRSACCASRRSSVGARSMTCSRPLPTAQSPISSRTSATPWTSTCSFRSRPTEARRTSSATRWSGRSPTRTCCRPSGARSMRSSPKRSRPAARLTGTGTRG